MSSILVVDDNSDIRSLVRMLINAAEGLEVAGEAATGRETLQVWAATQPDVIVLDHTMPDLSGMDVARAILAERPEQPIVMFTANASDPELGSALASGVCAVLSKEQVGSLIPTIRRAARRDPGRPADRRVGTRGPVREASPEVQGDLDTTGRQGGGG